MAQFGKMLDEALGDPKLVEGGMTKEEQARMRECMKDPEFVKLFIEFAKDLKENRDQYNFEGMVRAMEATGQGSPANPTGKLAVKSAAQGPSHQKPRGSGKLPEGIRAQQRRQLEENREQKRTTARQRAQAATVQRNIAALQQAASAKAARAAGAAGRAGSAQSPSRPGGTVGDLKALEALLNDVEKLKAEVASSGTAARAGQASESAGDPSAVEDKTLDALAAELTAPTVPKTGDSPPAVAPAPVVEVVDSTGPEQPGAMPAPSEEASLLPPKPQVPESHITYVQDADYGDFIEGERMNVSAVRGYSRIRLDVALRDDTNVRDVNLSVDSQFVTVEYPGYALHQPLLLKVEAKKATAKLRKAPAGGLCRQFSVPTSRYLEITLPLEKNDADALLRARETIELINAKDGQPVDPGMATNTSNEPSGLQVASGSLEGPEGEARASTASLPPSAPSAHPACPPEPPKRLFSANPEVLAKAKEWKTSRPAPQRMSNALISPGPSTQSALPQPQGKGLTDLLREKQKREDPATVLERLEAIDAEMRAKYPQLQRSNPVCFDVRGKVFSLLNSELYAAYSPGDLFIPNGVPPQTPAEQDSEA